MQALIKKRMAPGQGVYVGLIVLCMLLSAGCASTQRTTTTESTVAYPESETVYDDEDNRGVVQTSETTTATTETESGQGGIISSTVNAVGWIISLPFRIIGGLLNAIF